MCKYFKLYLKLWSTILLSTDVWAYLLATLMTEQSISVDNCGTTIIYNIILLERENQLKEVGVLNQGNRCLYVFFPEDGFKLYECKEVWCIQSRTLALKSKLFKRKVTQKFWPFTLQSKQLIDFPSIKFPWY